MSNDLGFEIPSWIDKTFFENILKKHTNNACTSLTNINFEAASKAGDGFASTIFRVICKSDKDYSFVVKMAPIEEGFKKQLLIQEMAFSVEIQMYNEVLPKMDKLLSDILGTNIQIGPKLIYHTLKPTPMMVLEDLITRGCERSKSTFGFEESKIVIKRLAQFHASSVFINEEILDLSNFKNTFFHTDKQRTDFSLVRGYVIPSLKMFIKAAEKHNMYDEIIMNRLKYFEENFESLLEEVYIKTENKKYLALIHADFHRKNMLFKHENGKLVDMFLFDYPNCTWSTPTVDLFYFFYQVASKETRVKHKEDLLKEYFEEYQLVLRKLNCKSSSIIPTLEVLKQELWKNRAAELMHITCFYKFQFMDWTNNDEDKDSNMDELTMVEAANWKKDFQDAAKPEIDRILKEGF